MIEVRPTVAVTPAQSVSGSSKGAVEARDADGNTLPKVGNESPKAVERVAEAASEKDVKAIEKSVALMNEYVQSVQRDLQFSFDEELDKTVIKVVDGGSGELIRQIPEEAFLELARKLNDEGDFNLVNAMG